MQLPSVEIREGRMDSCSQCIVLKKNVRQSPTVSEGMSSPDSRIIFSTRGLSQDLVETENGDHYNSLESPDAL